MLLVNYEIKHIIYCEFIGGVMVSMLSPSALDLVKPKTITFVVDASPMQL